MTALIKLSKLNIPEFSIERRIMRDKRVAADKAHCLFHDLANARRFPDHLIADPRQRLYFLGNIYARIHQALVAVDYLVILYENNGNFGWTSTLVRR